MLQNDQAGSGLSQETGSPIEEKVARTGQYQEATALSGFLAV